MINKILNQIKLLIELNPEAKYLYIGKKEKRLLLKKSYFTHYGLPDKLFNLKIIQVTQKSYLDVIIRKEKTK